MYYTRQTKEEKTAAIMRRRELVMAMQEPVVQPKLEINSPEDQFEQHADKVANKISNNEDASTLVKNQPTLNSLPQKKEEEENTLMAKSENGTLSGTDQLQTTLDSTKGGGQNLDGNTKTNMEKNMGVDLSDVKIHTDSKAHEMSEGINAKAFTHGSDIYFKQGNFNPETSEGKNLLGHELAHTVQQSGNVGRKIQRQTDQFGPSRDMLLIEIKERFMPVINKYDMLDFMNSMPEDQLKRMQELLYAIEPDLLADNFVETNYLVDGKRYSVQIGKYRLILVDGMDAPGGHHHVYYGVKSNTLIAKYVEINKKYDQKFDEYKAENKTSGAVSGGAAALNKVVSTNPGQSKKVVSKPDEKKNFASNFWNNNEQLLATLRKDPKKGHIIGYNVEKELGASGRYVELIQEALLFLDKDVPISKTESKDNIYGISTHKAVKIYQSKKGIKVTGQVDSITLETLDKDLVNKVASNKELHDTVKKYTSEKQEKEKNESDLRKIQYNKAGFIIFNLPPLKKEDLKAVGFDPSRLKFIYEEQGEFAEGMGLGGLKYNVEYDGAFLGYVTLQPKAGKPNRSSNVFYKKLYNGELPKYWDEFLKGQLFDLEFSEEYGGDPDLIYLIGRYAFANHWGMDKRVIASTGFDINPQMGVTFMRSMPNMRIKGPGGGRYRSGDFAKPTNTSNTSAKQSGYTSTATGGTNVKYTSTTTQGETFHEYPTSVKSEKFTKTPKTVQKPNYKSTNTTSLPKDLGKSHGMGPVKGTIEISSKSKSLNKFLHFDREKTVDFVFDSKSQRMLMFTSDSPQQGGHTALHNALRISEDEALGGRLRFSKNGELITSEWSGHTGENWGKIPNSRTNFKKFIFEMTKGEIKHTHKIGGVKP